MRIVNWPSNFVKFSIRWKQATLLATVVVMIAVLMWIASNFALGRSSAHSAGPAKKQQQGCCGDQPAISRRMIASYYTTEDDFQSTLILNNKGPNQIMVTPILHSRRGETFTASPVAVGGRSSSEVNLNILASIAGRDFRSGSVEFTYEGRLLEMGGGLRIVDSRKSLIFDEQMLQPGMKFPSSQLEAVYAIPFDDSKVEVIITNTTSMPILVNGSASFVGVGGRERIQERLGSYETEIIRLPHGMVKQASAGAVSLSHNGEKGSLLAMVHLQDEDRGYSETVNFVNPAGKTNERHGAGLRLGGVNGDPLKLVIAVRNLGDGPTTVNAAIPFSRQGGSKGTFFLPQASLAPGEVKLLNTSNSQLRQNDFATVGLEVKYTGTPGSVIVSASSVSRSGNHVFALPMKDPQGGLSSSGGYPWFIGESASTVVFIKNVTNEPQDFILSLIHADGTWRLNPRLIDPKQTIAVDVKKIRDSQEKGVDGDLMPSEAISGHISWGVRGKNVKALIGRAQMVDFENGIASTYECQCPCPPNWAGGSRIRLVGIEESDPLIAGESQGVAIEGSYFECFQGVQSPVPTWFPAPTWETQAGSLNPDIVNFDSSTQVTAWDEGTANLIAEWPAYVNGMVCPNPQTEECFCNATPITVHAVNTVTAVKADIGFGFDGGPSATQGVRDVITGEKVSLWLKPNNATNISWTITGTPHLKEYRIGPGSSTGEVVPTGPFNERNMLVHWVGNSSNPMGEQRQASVTFKVGSRTRTRSALFNLMTPLPSIITTNSGTIGVGPIPEAPEFAAWLYYGRSAAGVGVSFTNSDLPFPGQTQWVQIVNSDRRLTVAGLGNYQALSVGLDGTYPYPQINPFRVVDSPKQPIAINYSSIIVHDRFSMYFMFKSSIPGSIWVPLKVGEWGWDAAATNSPASGPVLVPGSANKVGPSIVSTTSHPTWQAIVTGPVFLPVP